MKSKIICIILSAVFLLSVFSVPIYAEPIETEEEIIPTPTPIKFIPESLTYDDGKLTVTVKAQVKDMSKLSGSYMSFAAGDAKVSTVSMSSLTPDSAGFYRFVSEFPTTSIAFRTAFVYGEKSITLYGTLSLIKAADASCTQYGTQKYSLKFDKVSYGTLFSEAFENPQAKPLGHSFVNGSCERCGEKCPVGDLNGDGKVNAIDANIMKQIVLGTDAPCIQADINGDGKVNAVDSNLLKALILGQ